MKKKLIGSNKYTGQEVRALEVRCDVGGAFWHEITSPLEAEQFESVLKSNYGWGVAPMVQHIMRQIKTDPMAIDKAYTEQLRLLRKLSQEKSPTDQIPTHVQRRTKHLALILLAYRLVLETLDIASQDRDDCIRRLTCFVLENMVQIESDNFKDGEKVEILRHFSNQLSANISRFLHTSDNATIPNTEIFGKIDRDRVSIISTKLDDLIKPWDRGRLLPLLKDESSALIIPEGRRNRNTHSVRIGPTNGECYVINLIKLKEWLDEHGGSSE